MRCSRSLRFVVSRASQLYFTGGRSRTLLGSRWMSGVDDERLKDRVMAAQLIEAEERAEQEAKERDLAASARKVNIEDVRGEDREIGKRLHNPYSPPISQIYEKLRRESDPRYYDKPDYYELQKRYAKVIKYSENKKGDAKSLTESEFLSEFGHMRKEESILDHT
eukprot:TRINITY_DN18936_c0_g1_i1.p1 TRINITY_DN18936_c0_g1~~TRINITY_DN18936_c0_g1_i1.p1  ORF type:complete len:165 (-),score=32.79 TRINITY_DN18936_c0_g1_i1:16-510(-)